MSREDKVNTILLCFILIVFLLIAGYSYSYNKIELEKDKYFTSLGYVQCLERFGSNQYSFKILWKKKCRKDK